MVVEGPPALAPRWQVAGPTAAGTTSRRLARPAAGGGSSTGVTPRPSARRTRRASPSTGSFRTASADAAAASSFVWSGDMVGQGWGINPDLRRDAASSRRCARRSPTSSSTAATPSTPTARSRDDRHAARRHASWTQRRHRPRSPRSPRRSTSTAASYPYNLLDENVPRVQRRGAAGLPVGRPRGPQQLVPRRRSSTDAALHREARRRSSPARAPAPSSSTPRCGRHSPATPSASTADLVRPAPRRVRARHAHATAAPNSAEPPDAPGRTPRILGAAAARVAQARAWPARARPGR